MATLRELRQSAGLTQEELAVKAGITSSTVRLLEKHGAKPQARTLAALRDVLGPEVDSIEWTVKSEARRRYRYLERKRAAGDADASSVQE